MTIDTAPPAPLAVPVTEACRMVGLGKSKLYEEIARGRITAKKLGNRTVILVASLRDYLDCAPTLGDAENDALRRIAATRSATK